jgi:hypothetical protein
MPEELQQFWQLTQAQDDLSPHVVILMVAVRNTVGARLPSSVCWDRLAIFELVPEFKSVNRSNCLVRSLTNNPCGCQECPPICVHTSRRERSRDVGRVFGGESGSSFALRASPGPLRSRSRRSSPEFQRERGRMAESGIRTSAILWIL